jgi:hypothetical protein
MEKDGKRTKRNTTKSKAGGAMASDLGVDFASHHHSFFPSF